MFRAAFLDPFQAPVATNFAVKQFGAKKAAVLFEVSNDYSKGLADNFRETWTLKRLNAEGMTIIVVEQNARLALEVADRGYVLDTGEIVAEGPAKELLHKPEIKSAYLGGESCARDFTWSVLPCADSVSFYLGFQSGET